VMRPALIAIIHNGQFQLASVSSAQGPTDPRKHSDFSGQSSGYEEEAGLSKSSGVSVLSLPFTPTLAPELIASVTLDPTTQG
jgi:hypothetical protein